MSNTFLKNSKFTVGLEQSLGTTRMYAGVSSSLLCEQVSNQTLLDPNFNCSNHSSVVAFESMFGSLF